MAPPLESFSRSERTENPRASQAGYDGLDELRSAAYSSQDNCKSHKPEDLQSIEFIGFEAKGAIEHIFRQNMQTWDRDANGWVSKEELDNARFDAKTTKESQVVVWHALRSNIGEIQGLSNDEYGLEDDGITLDDVIALQELKDRSGRYTRDEMDLIHELKMSAFDAGRMLRPVDAESSRADANAGRSPAEADPTSYSSITRKGNAHYVYRETENPNHPGVSYPSMIPRMIGEAMMMGWPKEIHEYLTKEKGGRYTGEEADLSGLDIEKLKRESKDGEAFHKTDPGTVVDVINNDGSLARYYSENKNWTVEQRAEARNYSQQADFQRMFKEHLALWDKDKNGALSRAEVLSHLDDKFQSRESALMIAALADSGSHMQDLADDMPRKAAADDYEVTAEDVKRLSRTFDDVVESLRDGKTVSENTQWQEMQRTLHYLNTQISRAELATGAPQPGATYRDLWRLASKDYKLK